MKSFLTTSIGKMLKWAQANSLWYITTGPGCCADEVLQTQGCRYDLERFGCLPQTDPSQTDLLIVTGLVTKKGAKELKKLYEDMPNPKFVMAVGSCAHCGGAFSPDYSYNVVEGVDRIIPVDVYVPGCPPRPEALMNGLIVLQNKIQERSVGSQRHYLQT